MKITVTKRNGSYHAEIDKLLVEADIKTAQEKRIAVEGKMYTVRVGKYRSNAVYDNAKVVHITTNREASHQLHITHSKRKHKKSMAQMLDVFKQAVKETTK